MKKLHIVSNRLPFSIVSEEDKFLLKPSVGGLATGMKSVYKDFEGRWIGWPGIATDSYTVDQFKEIEGLLDKEGCDTVPLTADEVHTFYEGFCNRTIWPLFHYFNQYVDYSPEFWESYVEVNQKFADKTLEVVEDGDFVWVHDYQLMLVPGMLKAKRPDITIGFFLHIPFPSYEVFRILPWRNELLEGLLGADLIGFHTYDYERHFLSSVRRLFGYESLSIRYILMKGLFLPMLFPWGLTMTSFMIRRSKQFPDPCRRNLLCIRNWKSIFWYLPTGS